MALRSDIEPSIVRPRNRTGIECIEGINEEKSIGSDGFDTQKGVEFMDLPFFFFFLRVNMTIHHALSAALR